MTTERYRMFAAYNAWANRRVYDAAFALPESDYRADRGAFFRSLHGTLNHLLVGDRLWMHRFDGGGPVPSRLDEILFEDRAELRRAREAEDARIVSYAEALTDEKLVGTIRYRTMSNPTIVEQPLWPALDHFFNHQTHHRGQAHALLTAISGAAPSLDMIVLQREAGFGGGRIVG